MSVSHGSLLATLATAPAAATGPLLAAAAVLVVAGLAKLLRPTPTAIVMARAGLGGRDVHARLLGGVEVVTGSAAVVLGGRLSAAAVGLCYLAFAAFTARQVASGEPADCGCFGAASAPTTLVHVVANAGLAALAGWASLAPVGGIRELWSAGAGTALGLLLIVAVATMALRALLTDLPAALAAGRGHAEAS